MIEINIGSLMGAIAHDGETKLSDHFEDESDPDGDEYFERERIKREEEDNQPPIW